MKRDSVSPHLHRLEVETVPVLFHVLAQSLKDDTVKWSSGNTQHLISTFLVWIQP